MTLYDILLLSVIVTTAYLGPVTLRRGHRSARLYGWMLVGDLAAAVLAMADNRGDNGIAVSMLGVMAIGAGVVLIVLPPILRGLARRALSSGRLGISRWLTSVRDLIQPGMARMELEFIETLLAVRQGRIDEIIERLEQRKREADDPRVRQHIEERAIMTLLYGARWGDAVDRFERAFTARGRDLSPQLLVEMIRAYCEIGQLDRGAELIERLEASPLAEEPMFSGLMFRARMVFLAFVGRPGAVEAIVGPTGPLAMMPAAHRHYWSGVAQLHAGDRSSAKNSLESAMDLSGREPQAKEMAEVWLASADERSFDGPRTVPSTVAELADRLAAVATSAPEIEQTPAVRLSLMANRSTPVTFAILGLNLAVALAISIGFGSVSDVGGLIRAGANLKSAVVHGEWWRLYASMFVHIGVVHLFTNMWVLWVIGRFVERMYGATRFFAVYAVSGVAGSAASLFLESTPMSAGASGAVLGVMGAVTVDLWVFRSSYPQVWRKNFLGMFVFIIGAQVAIGFMFPMIDQAAHLGGLVAGGLVALVVSPMASTGKAQWRRWTAGVLAALGVCLTAYSGFGVAVTSIADTVAGYGHYRTEVGGLFVEFPRGFRVANSYQFIHETGLVQGMIGRSKGASSAAEHLENRVREQLKNRTRGEGAPIRTAEAHKKVFDLPDGWESRELIDTYRLESEQRVRVVMFAIRRGDELWEGDISMPGSMADDLRPMVREILRSLSAE